ncbi:MAG: methionine ABC transporter ATP-binding protein, partial [Oscillospiraceae bacterium]|nr:methionine ABC transporter ATP-binding protein [Oscillospiraceae bacterium]
LNLTVVIITHEMDVVKQVCSRIAVLEDGVIQEIGLCSDLFLKESRALKDLIGEEYILPETGYNIKLLFKKEQSQMPIITKMAKDLNMDFSIVWGRLEGFKDEVLGSLIINVDKKYEASIKKYLDSVPMFWEEIE